LICLEDVSLNGTLHNDRKLSKSTVVLIEGDRIEYFNLTNSTALSRFRLTLDRNRRIGSRVFRFFQTIKDTSTSAPAANVSRNSTAIASNLSHALSSFQRVGDYTILPATLGSGAFATVVLAFNLKVIKFRFSTTFLQF